MKILFLARRFYPQIGGVERHALEISKRLVGKGHEVMVVCEVLSVEPSTSEESKSLLRHHPRRLEVYQIPTGKDNWFKKFRIWKRLWRNRRLIQQADVVHAHDVGFWYWPFRILYPSKPFFITFHGWEGQFPIPLKNKVVRKISEKIARGNICVGDYIRKWYGTKADYTTYGGISFFPPPRRSRGRCLATSEVSLPLVFIGRLEKDTGLPIYLKAWKKARNKLRYYKLDFCGDGKLRQEAEKYGKVLGFVKDVRPYLEKARFVFTSGYLSILEAMAGKRLVFAVYDNPLKEDYLKMAPFAKWIVIESDPKKLAEKVKYYLNYPEKEKELVNQAYNWAKKQSWGKVVELYLRLWRKR